MKTIVWVAALAALACLGMDQAFSQAVINGARTLPEISSGSISNPPANSLTTFVCDDGGTTKLCSKDSSGTVSMGLGGGGGGVTSTYDTWANLPGSPSSGDLFKSSDSPYECRYNGASWDCWAMGENVTVPDNSGYSDMSGGALDSIVSTRGVLDVTHNGAASTSLKGRQKNIGSSIEGCFQFMASSGPLATVGLYLIETGTGKIVTYAVGDEGDFTGIFWTNRTTFTSAYTLSTGLTNEFGVGQGPVCIRMDWEATNRVVYVKRPGMGSNWYMIHTVARNDSATTAFDQWGFVINSENSDPVQMVIWHLADN